AGTESTIAPAAKPGQFTELDDITLTGKVVDPSGTPVAGAEVAMSCHYEGEASSKETRLTASDGSFRFTVDPSCYYSLVATRGDSIAWASRPLQHEPEPLVMKLVPMATALLHVVDAKTGTPIANADVEASVFMATSDRATTDRSGTARIRWVDHRTFVGV